MTQALSRYSARAMTSVPDVDTLNALGRIESQLEKPGNTPAALRALKGLIASDIGLRRAWELGAGAFKSKRYEYVPPAAIRRRIHEAQSELTNGDRREALRIARELIKSDPNIKEAWEIGASAFR